MATHTDLNKALQGAVALVAGHLEEIVKTIESLPTPGAPKQEDNQNTDKGQTTEPCHPSAAPSLLAAAESVRSTLLGHAQEASGALEALQERSDAATLSVLVAGLLKSGKSSLVNALLAAACSPIGDEAATSVVLTARADPERKDFVLWAARSARELARGGARAMSTRIQQINTNLRALDSNPTTANRGDSDEAELLMLTPANAFTDDGLSLEIIDSPGGNEDLTPTIRTRWQQAVEVADVLLVVVPYSPCGARDEGELWRQIARDLPPGNKRSQGIALFINKYDQADVDDENGATEHRERTKAARIEFVRKATNGQLILSPYQVFLGCARDAMIARIILKLPVDDKDTTENAFNTEHKTLIGLVKRVFLKKDNTKSDFPNTRALLAVEKWEEVLQNSGFPELESFLRMRARVSAIAHARKLVALARGHGTKLRQLAQSFTTALSHAERSSSATLADITSAEALLKDYFDDQARLEDKQYGEQLNNALDLLRDRLRVALDRVRRNDSFKNFPEQLNLTEEGKEVLRKLLDEFHKVAGTVIKEENTKFKQQIRDLTARRQELRHRFNKAVENIFTTQGIAVPMELLKPDDVVPTPSAAVQTPEDSVDAKLDQSLSWIDGFVGLDTGRLMQDARHAVRTTFCETAPFQAAGNFRSIPSYVVGKVWPKYTGSAGLGGAYTITCNLDRKEGREGWVFDNSTCMLFHGGKVGLKISVDAAFVGQPFTLELEHLTEYTRKDPSAAVTVTLNGSIVQKNFDPRTAHEVNNNRAGCVSFVKDRWFVDPAYVRAGENLLEIEQVSGNSNYSLHSWSLSASGQITKHQNLSRDDVLAAVLSAVLAGLVPSDANRALFEQLVADSSPLTAQRRVTERCTQLLRALAEAKDSDVKTGSATRAVLEKISKQCRELQITAASKVAELAKHAASLQEQATEPTEPICVLKRNPPLTGAIKI